MTWRLLPALALAAAVPLAVLAYTRWGTERAELMELPLDWPSSSEIFSTWCGSGTRTASAEAAILSCDGDCYALLRYWAFLPARGREIQGEVPVEVRLGGELLLREEVAFGKEPSGIYVQTPVLLIRVPEGAVVRVADSSLEIPGCSKSRPTPPRVIYTRGSLGDWEEPLPGLNLARLMGGVHAARWEGAARLSCGSATIPLRELGEGEVAIISVGEGGCDLEVGGRRFHLGG